MSNRKCNDIFTQLRFSTLLIGVGLCLTLISVAILFCIEFQFQPQPLNNNDNENHCDVSHVTENITMLHKSTETSSIVNSHSSKFPQVNMSSIKTYNTVSTQSNLFKERLPLESWAKKHECALS